MKERKTLADARRFTWQEQVQGMLKMAKAHPELHGKHVDDPGVLDAWIDACEDVVAMSEPFCFACSIARSTASRCPAMTACPGQLMFAGDNT